MILPLQDMAAGDVRSRLERGQLFNAYAFTAGGFAVGIGPISDLLGMFAVEDADTANQLVDTLREIAGQGPCLCPVSETSDADDDDLALLGKRHA